MQNQRDRLTVGVIAVVAERGYRDATISQICAAAGVSRKTFYSYFGSKEQCFVEAYEAVASHLVDAMRAAGGEGDWAARVSGRLDAVLQTFAANPDLARFFIIAPLRAGDRIAEYQVPATERLLAELTQDQDASEVPARPVSSAVEHAQIGGLMGVIAQKVEAGQARRLADLLPELVELFLTPYLRRARG